MKELTEAIEKQKEEVKAYQKRLREDSSSAKKSYEKIRNLTSLERASKIRTEKPYNIPIRLTSVNKSKDFERSPPINEDLLQYTYLLSQVVEGNVKERDTLRKS